MDLAQPRAILMFFCVGRWIPWRALGNSSCFLATGRHEAWSSAISQIPRVSTVSLTEFCHPNKPGWALG